MLTSVLTHSIEDISLKLTVVFVATADLQHFLESFIITMHNASYAQIQLDFNTYEAQ